MILSFCLLIIAFSLYDKLNLFKGDKALKDFITRKLKNERQKFKYDSLNSKININRKKFDIQGNFSNKNLFSDKFNPYKKPKSNSEIFRLLEIITDRSNRNISSNNLDLNHINIRDASIETNKNLTSNDFNKSIIYDFKTKKTYQERSNSIIFTENSRIAQYTNDKNDTNISTINSTDSLKSINNDLHNNSSDNDINKDAETKNTLSDDDNNINLSDNNDSSKNGIDRDKIVLPIDNVIIDEKYFLHHYLYNNSYVESKFKDICFESDYNFPDEIAVFLYNYIEENDDSSFLFKRFESLIDSNSYLNFQTKDLLKKISNFEHNIAEDEITIFKFVGSSLVLLIILLFIVVIGWITCCACAWYDYCPIICKLTKSNKYGVLIKLLPISVMVLISLSLIIPTYFLMKKYRYFED